MKKSKLKILCILTSLLMVSVSFVAASALSTYDDGDYSFAETSDESFVALYGLSKTATQDEVDVVVPDSSMGKFVISVYEYAFYENQSIKSVDFLQTRHLNYIDSHAFSKSTIGGEVVFPASIRSIGYAAFQECNNLNSVSFGNGLTEIPAQCFYKCQSLAEVSIARNVQKIDRLAFAGCPMLNKVFIPESVNEINNSAFNGSNDIVIYCYTDTYAHQFAENKHIPYILLDGPITGDVNGDGSVDILDSTEIQKYAAEKIDLTEEQFELADINNDGFVDVMDALLVQKYVVGAYDIPPIIYNS